MDNYQIPFDKALGYIKNLRPGNTTWLPLDRLVGRTLAEDIVSKNASPSVRSSRKDGFAVISSDLNGASREKPVRLHVVGSAMAGEPLSTGIDAGQALRIMTGAMIPEGADAVLASEFTIDAGNRRQILATAPALAGKNILEKGADVHEGQLLARRGDAVGPSLIAMLAGAGIEGATVYEPPRVALLATGSEIVDLGSHPGPGKIFPSNQYTALAWLRHLGIKAHIFITDDDGKGLESSISGLLDEFDVLITSGGLLDGDRDLVLRTMQGMGTHYFFNRVRMGPGKGVCMGRYGDTIVFNLPGGPPSNYLSFLLLALPGILRLSGRSNPFLPMIKVWLTKEIRGRREWTQFVFATIHVADGRIVATQCKTRSRLAKIALADCVVIIPEGIGRLKEDTSAEAYLIRPLPV